MAKKTLWDFCDKLARKTIRTTPPDVLRDICATMDSVDKNTTETTKGE